MSHRGNGTIGRAVPSEEDSSPVSPECIRVERSNVEHATSRATSVLAPEISARCDHFVAGSRAHQGRRSAAHQTRGIQPKTQAEAIRRLKGRNAVSRVGPAPPWLTTASRFARRLLHSRAHGGDGITAASHRGRTGPQPAVETRRPPIGHPLHQAVLFRIVKPGATVLRHGGSGSLSHSGSQEPGCRSYGNWQPAASGSRPDGRDGREVHAILSIFEV
jgi:hypothetical protein